MYVGKWKADLNKNILNRKVEDINFFFIFVDQNPSVRKYPRL